MTLTHLLFCYIFLCRRIFKTGFNFAKILNEQKSYLCWVRLCNFNGVQGFKDISF